MLLATDVVEEEGNLDLFFYFVGVLGTPVIEGQIPTHWLLVFFPFQLGVGTSTSVLKSRPKWLMRSSGLKSA